MNDFAKQLFSMHKRIAIYGAPGVGKTTFTKKYFPDREVVHSDDFMALGWSGSSKAVASSLSFFEEYVVEGAIVPRAIRKGLNPTLIVHLKREGFVPDKKHEAMYKQMQTIINQLPVTIVEIVEANHE